MRGGIKEKMTRKRINGVFATILVSGIACSMLSTALSTALPRILKDFRIDSIMGQWLTSVYSLVMGIATLTTPFLIRKISAKRLYLGTLLLFTAGLLLSGCTFSYWIMMAGRVLQAAGNGVMVAQGQVLILTLYPPERRGFVMGLYGLIIGTSPVIAPTLAGIVVDLCGWRMIFYLVAAVALASAVMTAVLFADLRETGDAKLDILSLLLCSLGICGLLLGAGNIGKYSFLNVRVWLPVLLGAGGTFLFSVRQLRTEQPFMELRVLAVPDYRLAVIASMIMYATVMGSTVLLPIYIQSVRGYSATVSGLATMPGALATALISPFSGKLYDRLGIRPLFLGGGILLAVSNLGMMSIMEAGSLFTIGLLNVVRCTGIGCLMMPFVTWGMSSLEKEQTSHGTALITSLRTVAGAFGAALFVAVYQLQAVKGSAVSGMQYAFAGLGVFGTAEIVLAVYVMCRKRIGSSKEEKNAA